MQTWRNSRHNLQDMVDASESRAEVDFASSMMALPRQQAPSRSVEEDVRRRCVRIRPERIQTTCFVLEVCESACGL